MKLAFIAFLLFVGTISAQIPTSTAACLLDIKADVELVQQLLADYEAKDTLKILADLLKAKSLLDKTEADCKDILPSHIVANLDLQLTPEQKECAAQIIATIEIAQKVAADVEQKNWTAAISAAAQLVIALNNTKAKCTAAAFKAIAN